MITIKTGAEIEKMYVSGQMLGKVLAALRKEIHEGVTTLQLDRMAEDMIRSMGAVPSFKDYHGFPYTICASLNETVVHGFANDKPLESGQLLSIDCGLVYDGWQADSAFSVGIGEVSSEVQKLMDVTEECFWKAVEVVKPGNRLGDIGNAVQTHAEAHGYGVIRDMCGHGIGREMHEDPNVPNYGRAGHGIRLREGMTIAIEPMIALGDYHIRILKDGWTCVTRDGSFCSHYEHTIAVTDKGARILTLPEESA